MAGILDETGDEKRMLEQEKDKDFSKIYHLMIDNGILAKMSNKDIRVFLTINRFANYDTGWAYPTTETIVRLSGASKNDIASSVKRLHLMGFLSETKRAGARFQFRKMYKVAKREEINPEIALSTIPKKKEQCRGIPRGEDGRFKPLPNNTEKDIPKNKEKDIPQSKDLSIIPENTEEKENNRDKKYRDRGIETATTGSSLACLESQASPNSQIISEQYLLNSLVNRQGIQTVKTKIEQGEYVLGKDVSLDNVKLLQGIG